MQCLWSNLSKSKRLVLLCAYNSWLDEPNTSCTSKKLRSLSHIKMVLDIFSTHYLLCSYVLPGNRVTQTCHSAAKVMGKKVLQKHNFNFQVMESVARIVLTLECRCLSMILGQKRINTQSWKSEKQTRSLFICRNSLYFRSFFLK